MSQNEQIDQSEIYLLDIVNFVQESWKKLAIASMVGAVLGFTGWSILGVYQAEYILLNNNSNNANIMTNTTPTTPTPTPTTNSYALDLVSWKMLQKSLPNLAAQIVEENKVPQDQASLYKAMSNEQWWQKNVLPSYALSKADAKDLAGISKDLDAASTTILNFTLTASGSSKEESIANVRASAKFLRSGSAYLQIRSMLNGYESLTVSTVADLQQKLTSTQIEMGYQQERAKSLEELHKRFPGSTIISGQVVDTKDSAAKYLPLATQIVGANNDINSSKESLARLQKRLEQIGLIKAFIEQAVPLRDQTFDGLALNDQLIAIEGSLRSKLAKGDANGQELLDQLHSQLLAIQVRFTKGLEANTAPTASKKGMIKSTAGGLAAAFFLMLLALLGGRVWLQIKSGGAK